MIAMASSIFWNYFWKSWGTKTQRLHWQAAPCCTHQNLSEIRATSLPLPRSKTWHDAYTLMFLLRKPPRLILNLYNRNCLGVTFPPPPPAFQVLVSDIVQPVPQARSKMRHNSGQLRNFLGYRTCFDSARMVRIACQQYLVVSSWGMKKWIMLWFRLKKALYKKKTWQNWKPTKQWRYVQVAKAWTECNS